MKNVEIIRYFIVVIIIILISTINHLDRKNKVRIQLLMNGLLNKFLLIFLIFLITMYDYMIGLVLFILFFSIHYSNKLIIN